MPMHSVKASDNSSLKKELFFCLHSVYSDGILERILFSASISYH